jgi:serine/threonine protein kinase
VQSRAVIGMIGGRYRLEGLLGEGGMARVFDAFDERLERPVAVKVLRPETETLPGMRERFQQEARLAARLVHPNIVAVLDYGEDTASSYLVMERLPGSTLRDEISRGPISPVRLVPTLTETLSALAAAHKFGVLHRDIKPSNILLQDDGHAKITDFGIAKSFDGSVAPDPATQDWTMTGVVLGTPGYLAPERRAGEPATVQSDLYSVGAVMVEALTGHRVGPSTEVDPHVPPPLRGIAAQALAPDPRDRFASADAMIEALRALDRPSRNTGPLGASAAVAPTRELAASPIPVRDGTAPLLGRPPVVAPPRPTRRRRRLWITFAVLAAAAVALLTLFLVHRNPSAPPAHTTSQHTAGGRHAPIADTEGTAIRQAAASLVGQGQPGDAALAAALDATAAQSPGPARQAAADQTLALAQVLLAGSGITYGQYQDVVSVLGPTGATVPTTTVPPTTLPPTAPTPAGPPPGHGHGHGGQGDQG